MDSQSGMTTDLFEPVDSLEEIKGSAVLLPRQPSSRAFRPEQMEISDGRSDTLARIIHD